MVSRGQILARFMSEHVGFRGTWTGSKRAHALDADSSVAGREREPIGSGVWFWQIRLLIHPLAAEQSAS
jgi:hypothetical protein